MNQPAHSPLGASGMSRWSKCPGSVRMEAKFPDQTSDYAEEGTRAHELAEKCLRAGADAVELSEPGGHQEMSDAVQVYLDTIRSDIPDGPHSQRIEQRFDLSSVHPGCFGTADFVLWDEKARVLRVYDYKHGQGVAVEVRDNPQLQYYALGALLESGFPAEEVEMIVVQPRCPHPDGHVRRWRIDTMDLLDFRADLADFARATENPDAPLVPGDHCRFCKAAGACPALHEKATEVAKREFTPQAYDPKQLADTLAWLPVLETWCKNVREFAYAEAEHGRNPPGYKLVQKQGRRTWVNPDEQLPALASKYGIEPDELFEKKPVGIGAAEKVIRNAAGLKAKEAKAALDEYTVIPATGTTLVAESDPRPALRKDPAAEFTTIESEKPS